MIIVHTIHGGPNIFDLSLNSQKRHAREEQSIPYLVYSIEQEPNHPIIFDKDEILPLHDYPWVITAQVVNYKNNESVNGQW